MDCYSGGGFDKDEEEEATKRFVELLQFRTVSGSAPHDGSYETCGKWLMDELERIGLVCFILEESVPHKPIVIGSWVGSQPHLPCVLLNSHYDVVPVIEDKWVVPAFDGLIQDGRIYGRGAQDMKCVCAQYITAIGKLKKEGFCPTRTVHLSFVPDEEIGGAHGMNVLTESEWFSTIDVGLALDEGLASEDGCYSVFYGERLPWWVRVTAQGNTGHGSRFIDTTAVEQVVSVVNKGLAFREEQRNVLHGVDSSHVNCSHSVAKARAIKNRAAAKETGKWAENALEQDNGGKINSVFTAGGSSDNSSTVEDNAQQGNREQSKTKPLTLGDVTSLNVTMLQAGVVAGGVTAVNIVPPSAEAGFDIRISPNEDPAIMRARLDVWCEEASVQAKRSNSKTDANGNELGSANPALGVSWSFYHNSPLEQHAVTATDDSNPWWRLLKDTLGSINIDVVSEVFPAATDSRFLRVFGVKAFGFSPMRYSPILLHEHNEYLDRKVYLEGCHVYVTLLKALLTNEDFS